MRNTRISSLMKVPIKSAILVSHENTYYKFRIKNTTKKVHFNVLLASNAKVFHAKVKLVHKYQIKKSNPHGYLQSITIITVKIDL